MKKIFFLILVLTVSISLIHAQRNRVYIDNGTLVTDKGTLLRGACFSTDFSNDIPSGEEISAIKTLGLNTLHLYAECPALYEPAGQKVKAVDSIVNMTERDSLYLIITIGNCGDEGTFDSAFVNDFWKFYAPRYKDKTHIIYEIMNEPFPWSSPYYSQTLAMEKRAYDTIRFYAPETHIMFMSYSWPINANSVIDDIKQLGEVNWNNASIATHGYQVAPQELVSFLRTVTDSGYAVTCTELEEIQNIYMNTAVTRVFEQEQISYTHFIYIPEISNNPQVYVNLIESSELRWSPDFGTWPANLASINYKDPYQKIIAGYYDDGSGFKLHSAETTIGYISNEDYAGYYNFDFGPGPDSVTFEYSSGYTNCTITVLIDSLNGTKIGTFPVETTGDWNTYKLFSFPITNHFDGIHSFFIVFNGDPQLDLINLKSIQFREKDPDLSGDYLTMPSQSFIIYPNPVHNYFKIQSDDPVLVEVYSLQGQLLIIKNIFPDDQQIFVNNLSPGSYVVKIINNTISHSEILIVE